MPIHHLDRVPKHKHVQRSGRASFFSWRKFFSYFVVIGIAVFLAGSVAFVGMLAWVSKDLPDPNNITQRSVAQTTKIYDRTGKVLLYDIHGDEKRTVVQLADISAYVKEATIAAEDKDFYHHGGFDMKSIARSIFVDIIHGGKVQGGSTITQQFIKNSVLSNEKTFTRKIKELMLSFAIERRFTKDQILQLYLNEIPYGSVSYGIESASQTYFGKSAKDLTLSESALLAALPKAPTYYSPYGNHASDLVARQRYILDQMVDQGYVSKNDADAAKKDDVMKRIVPRHESIIAPHFVFWVRDQLADQLGDDVVERGGIKVTTTLDIDKQKIAEQAIADHRDNIKQWNANTAALAALDPKNGNVLAMVGSADYFDNDINGQFNSLLGSLQPGSSIKPIVYAAAFEKGYTPSTVVYDINTTFKNQPTDYQPTDYDGKERGPVTLKEALAGSLNVPAVQVLYLLGIDKFMDFAKRVGYTTFTDPSKVGLSLVLGGANVKPIEHIAAYSAFAQEGMLRPTVAVLKVEDKDGNVLIDNTADAPGTQVFDPEIARQITGIISDNSARAFIFGEHNFLTLPNRPIAAKTGTTNRFKDAWTIGYTPSLVAGVWVGDSKGRFMKSRADGSVVAAPIWNEFMSKALAGTPVEQFTPPQPVVTGKPILDGDKRAQMTVKIDRISGKLATDLTPPEDVIFQGYGVPHSILYFIDRNDPRGPAPTNPENDPQFSYWEQAVATWAAKQGILPTAPPIETDDVHSAANAPTISFLDPVDGGVLSSRAPAVSVNASAPRGVARVVYFIDGENVGSSNVAPFTATLTIPNHITKGFHVLAAKVYDDIDDNSQASITINFTADPGPTAFRWISPTDQTTIAAGAFPTTIAVEIDDPKSIASIKFSAQQSGNNDSEQIGEIDNPTAMTLSLPWPPTPAAGTYQLMADITLISNETVHESITVKVK